MFAQQKIKIAIYVLGFTVVLSSFFNIYYTELRVTKESDFLENNWNTRIHKLQLENRYLKRQIIELQIASMSKWKPLMLGKRPLVIAHRGYSSIAPENTIASVQQAIDASVDMIEVDIHISKDEVPVVIHDHQINRTTNGNGYVKNMTVPQLKRVSIKNMDSSQYGEERIPTLEEVWKLCERSNMLLYLDLKTNHNGKALTNLIRNSGLNPSILYFGVSSFIQIRDLYEYGFENTNIIWYGSIPSIPTLPFINKMKRFGVIAIELDKNDISSEWVTICHQNHLQIWCYTVNEQDEMQKVLNMGVNAIETNFCNRLIDLVNLGTVKQKK